MGVRVAVHLLWVGEIHDGVDRDEAAGGGVVLAGAQVDQAGRVFGAADEAALLAHCRARLAAYKLPRLFKFVAESDLPLTVTGKIQKNRIAAVIFPPPA